MGTYTRLGSYLLASELASDPFGAIYRAVVITGSSFDRHVLVRTFSEELFQAGMNARLVEAGRVATLLGGARSSDWVTGSKAGRHRMLPGTMYRAAA